MEGHYRGYIYQDTDFGWALFLDADRYLEFETESEMFNYVDELEDDANKVIPRNYYVYRIRRTDEDTYNNYQFYDGKRFRYDVSQIFYLTENEADILISDMRKVKDGFNYHKVKKHR